MSLDVADMDADGDRDVVVGEHNLANPASARLFIFENLNGRGSSWTRHTVYMGDEHHDGAQVADMDGDGDLDIVSIGWGHNRVLLYENRRQMMKHRSNECRRLFAAPCASVCEKLIRNDISRTDLTQLHYDRRLFDHWSTSASHRVALPYRTPWPSLFWFGRPTCRCYCSIRSESFRLPRS